MGSKSQKGSGIAALIIAAAVLLGSVGAMVYFRQDTAKQEEIIRAEKLITPLVTATVMGVSATRDPALITPTPAPTTVNMASGSAGNSVTDLQQRLKELGYYTGEVDGQFGSGTQAAVRFFQAQHGLDVDGIAGPKTWEMLTSSGAHAVITVDTLAGETPYLVNKAHPVDAGFVPANLIYLKDIFDESYITLNSQSLQAVEEAALALKEMLAAAHAEGIGPWKIRECYRTYQEQKRIMDNRVRDYEAEGRTHAQAVSAAKNYVAEPGTSEHHTGLAFDLNVPGAEFADTAQYAWIAVHCWEYGFILRYPDDKDDVTGFLGEEWHYRYVGKEHSLRMRDSGQVLEEYLSSLGAGN